MSKADKAIHRKLMKGKNVSYINAQGQRVVIDGKKYLESLKNRETDQSFLWYGEKGSMLLWALWTLRRLWSSTAIPSQVMLVLTLLSPAIAFLLRGLLGIMSPAKLTQDGRRIAKYGANQWFMVFMLLACTAEATSFCWWLWGGSKVSADKFYTNGFADVMIQAMVPTLFGFVGSTMMIVVTFQQLPYRTYLTYAIKVNMGVTAIYCAWGLANRLIAVGGGATVGAIDVAGDEAAVAAAVEGGGQGSL